MTSKPYIFLVGETGEDDLDPLIDELGPRVKEVIMTTAERLLTEGHARGRMQGRVEGQVELLLAQLSTKFGPLSPRVTERVRNADAAHLMAWSQSLLVAMTLDDVFTSS